MVVVYGGGGCRTEASIFNSKQFGNFVTYHIMANFKVHSLDKEFEELGNVQQLRYQLGKTGQRSMTPRLVDLIRAPDEKQVILSVAYDFN